MDVTIQIKAMVPWAAKRLPSGAMVGVCDPLGVTIEARDEGELRSMIEETLHTLFLDLLEDGELEQFLRDRGWAPNSPLPHGAIPEGGVRFEVPFEVVSSPAHGRP